MIFAYDLGDLIDAQFRLIVGLTEFSHAEETLQTLSELLISPDDNEPHT